MMPTRVPVLAAAAAAALASLMPPMAVADGLRPPFRLAMMDMMPMGDDGGMQQPGSAGGMGMDDGRRMAGMQGQPAQGGAGTGGMPGMGQPGANPQPGGMGRGAMMGDDMMRMGGGGMQAQVPHQPMAGCMAMMQNMMRSGASQQGMPPMQGGAGPAAGPGMVMGGAPAMGSPAARLEGRIAFLRTELRITPAQAPAWDAFADTLRSGREHLDQARAALQDSATAADPMARLEGFERHLRQRTEAIHMTRMAFDTLYGQLDDAQKRAATATMLPFIGAF